MYHCPSPHKEILFKIVTILMYVNKYYFICNSIYTRYFEQQIDEKSNYLNLGISNQ